MSAKLFAGARERVVETRAGLGRSRARACTCVHTYGMLSISSPTAHLDSFNRGDAVRTRYRPETARIPFAILQPCKSRGGFLNTFSTIK